MNEQIELAMDAGTIALTTSTYWCSEHYRLIQERCMTKLAIPHNAWVFIGDGQKALFLRNAGDEHFPNLTTERVFVDENPRTHEQGTDRPGRAFKRAV